MGRADAVQVILEVVAEFRRLLPSGLVTYESGWETLGNGSRPNYNYGNGHHTAFLSSAAKPFPAQGTLRNGRPDLSGPLCNFAGPWCTVEQPRLHVVAANPANHAGASRASGPVPALSLYNPRSLGLEIDYAGLTPMTAGQMLVFKAWAKAVAKVVGGGNIEVVRAHAETSVTGKWDPGYANGKTIDMAAFRRAAAAITPGSTALPQEEDDMPKHLRAPNGTIFLFDGKNVIMTGDPAQVARWREMFGAEQNVSQAYFNEAMWLDAYNKPDGRTLREFHEGVARRVEAIQQELEAGGSGTPVNIDAAAVKALLVKDTDFHAALAKAVNDDAARRLAS